MSATGFWTVLLLAAVVVCGCSSEFRRDLDRAGDLYEEGEPREARRIALCLADESIEDEDDAVALADLLRRVGEAKRAAELLRDRTLSPEGHDVLADAWLAAGDVSRAGVEVERLIDREQATPRTLRIRGKLLLKRGEAKRAVEVLRESLDRDEDQPMTWVFLGTAELLAGRRDVAEETLRTARRRFPDSPEVALALANAILSRTPTSRGARQEAVELIQPAVERRPLDRASRSNLALLLRDLDRLTEAELVLAALTSEWPDDPKAWSDLGIVRMKRGRVEAGVEAFRHAAGFAPMDREIQLNLGNALLDLANEAHDPEAPAKEAEAVFRGVIRRWGTDPRGYVGAAQTMLKVDAGNNERADRARQLYLRAVKLDPANFDANLGLAVHYYDLWAKGGTQSGEGRRKALEHFERAAAVIPPEKWDAGPRNAYEDLRK